MQILMYSGCICVSHWYVGTLYSCIWMHDYPLAPYLMFLYWTFVGNIKTSKCYLFTLFTNAPMFTLEWEGWQKSTEIVVDGHFWDTSLTFPFTKSQGTLTLLSELVEVQWDVCFLIGGCFLIGDLLRLQVSIGSSRKWCSFLAEKGMQHFLLPFPQGTYPRWYVSKFPGSGEDDGLQVACKTGVNKAWSLVLLCTWGVFFLSLSCP